MSGGGQGEQMIWPKLAPPTLWASQGSECLGAILSTCRALRGATS
jgi:hypothetical protein